MRIIILITLFTAFLSLRSQHVAKIDESLVNPDIKVMISSDLSFPDLKIQYGLYLNDPDITVFIGQKIEKSNLIITKSDLADQRILCGEEIENPDIKILARSDLKYADFRISFVNEPNADCDVYFNETLNFNRVLAALLPIMDSHYSLHNYFESHPVISDLKNKLGIKSWKRNRYIDIDELE
ncbi:MAG: hypothetical protein CMC96_09320 [Flavobacteriales bacterium]|nr:hypothetical protein [Flavobacteriales bacterium]|tara:strand:- start:8149 stop:8694 length:546 start_codon:yes stop_codon:yes gene_type:complete